MPQKKSNSVKRIVAIGGAAFFALLIYLSMRQTQQKYEVCVAFKGSTHCATAAGSTEKEAVSSAQEIDCQLLSNGRDDLMVCLSREPSSIRQLPQ